jgi:DNA-binding XRE family transcriptional regulator
VYRVADTIAITKSLKCADFVDFLWQYGLIERMIQMINIDMIKAKRKKAGLSMQEAAELAGLAGRERWNQLENGPATQDPRVSTMQAIAIALKCTVDELLLPPKITKTK